MTAGMLFFAPKPNDSGNVVVCVRIENCQGSSVAVKLAGKHVVPILTQMGYIKGFGEPKKIKEQQLNNNQQVTTSAQQRNANIAAVER